MAIRAPITVLLAAVVTALGCGQSAREPAKVPAAAQAPAAVAATNFLPEKVSARHLPNPWRIHPQVISGGLPAGDAAFTELAMLGIKTVISVDGARPDLTAAQKHGLRYVHLPHGYDGVSGTRAAELAKAVRDLPGPIYIHCHHGKHRSPTAAAVACVGAGLLLPAAAEPILQAAGTSEAYQGLYQAARAVRPLDSAFLNSLPADFPEVAKLPPLAEAMVALEHTHDHLQQVAAAGWKSPPGHPDISPAHEALLLREHFTEMLRLESIAERPPEFRQLLAESEAAARQLETALRSWNAASKLEPPATDLATPFATVSAHCKTCHTKYRDVPAGPVN